MVSIIVMVLNTMLMLARMLEICGGRVALATLMFTSTCHRVVDTDIDVERFTVVEWHRMFAMALNTYNDVVGCL